MNARKTMTAAPTRVMKAMDMAKHANLSDVWPTKVTLNSIAGLMSHVGRVMLGRPLLFGDTDAMYLDLENGKALRVTLVDIEDAFKPLPAQNFGLSVASAKRLTEALDALQELVHMDDLERKEGNHGYSLRSPYAKTWARARKVLKS